MHTNTAAKRLADFSFVSGGKWAPERSGDYDRDCRTGRRYAGELLRGIRESGNPALIGGVARLISEAAAFDGVEAGFWSKLGCALAA
jgi:hypothetical protein